MLAGYNNTAASDFALARYNLNGTLDSTFGTTGVITTSFGTGVDEAHAVLVQPTGKIVAVGFSRQAATHNDFALARYLPGGTLDTTFGTGGSVLTDLQSSSDDQALAAVVQPDNMIVAAGTSDNGTATELRPSRGAVSITQPTAHCLKLLQERPGKRDDHFHHDRLQRAL